MKSKLQTELDLIPGRRDAGIVWLKEHYPDYRKKVNPLSLSMQNCFWCVLGQVAGDFWDVVSGIEPDEGTPRQLTEQQAAALGFHVADGLSSQDADDYFDALTAAWVEHLTTPEEMP